MRSSAERLEDIKEAIDRIQAYEAALTPSLPRTAEMAYFDAILYRLVVLGEAIKALPKDVTDRASDVNWRDVTRLRDLLTHHYQKVDLEQIRETCDEPLMLLALAVSKLRGTAI